MITRENLDFCLNAISKEKMEAIMENMGDYVLLQLSIYNAGGVVHIESVDYNEDIEKMAIEDGDVYADKDTFEILLKESNSKHKSWK